jgi:hypothetical protein
MSASVFNQVGLPPSLGSRCVPVAAADSYRSHEALSLEGSTAAAKSVSTFME